jgi:hypothetical protein
MNRDRAQGRADRKALLIARADLDRARIALAVQDLRAVVSPPPLEPDRLDAYRSKAKWVVAFAIPVLGRARLGRWLRAASLGLVAYRLVRAWRSGGR